MPAGMASQKLQRRPHHPRLVDGAHTRAYHQCHPRQSTLFFFDELIVRRAAAKRAGQHLFQECNQLQSEELNPLTGQLLVTANVP